MSALWFRLQPGQETRVRFLEQDDDIFWAMMHEVPVEGRAWGRDVPCVDQSKNGTPCPGCEQDLPRRFKGYINVVWFDAPLFKRDNAGKMVKDSSGDPVMLGTKPQVAVWSSGIRLFEELDEINANFRGLRSRRFKVKRKGSGIDTKYVISPEDIDSGPQPFTKEESDLESNKYDLAEFVKSPTYEEFLKEIGQIGDGNHKAAAPQPPANPFLKQQAS